MNDEVGGVGPATLPVAVLDWENEGGHSVSAGRRRDRADSGPLGNRTALITAAPKVKEADLPDRTDCIACGHSLDAHDKIARRFCDTTVERAFTRGVSAASDRDARGAGEDVDVVHPMCAQGCHRSPGSCPEADHDRA